MIDRRSLLLLSAAGGACALGLYWPTRLRVAPALALRGGDEFGIRSDARTDDMSMLQGALDKMSRAGGGTLRLAQGATTLVKGSPIVGDDVVLDLNGGTLQLVLTEPNATGVRLRNHAEIRNGTVRVQSLGRPSLQGGAHCPVVVGPLYGSGGEVGAPSPDEGVTGWTIADVTLISDKNTPGDDGFVGAPGIQILGGASQGRIRNVTIPDSDRMLGGVHLDWAFVGNIASSAVARNAAAFAQGRAYTTHPHGIEISNIRIGKLTRFGRSQGTYGIRLSGAYDVTVQHVSIGSVTGAAFLHHAGDLGFEFAREPDRKRALLGNRFTDCEVREALSSCLIQSDSYADNVARATAAGYAPELSPILPTDVRFERIKGRASGRQGRNYGVRIDHQSGGALIDCTAEGYRRGFYIDEQVSDLQLIRPTAIDSLEFGISIEHNSAPPRRITVTDPRVRGSGRQPNSSMTSGILVGASDGVVIADGDIPVSPSQRWMIRVAPQARNARVTGRNAKAVTRQ